MRFASLAILLVLAGCTTPEPSTEDQNAPTAPSETAGEDGGSGGPGGPGAPGAPGASGNGAVLYEGTLTVGPPDFEANAAVEIPANLTRVQIEIRMSGSFVAPTWEMGSCSGGGSNAQVGTNNGGSTTCNDPTPGANTFVFRATGGNGDVGVVIRSG